MSVCMRLSRRVACKVAMSADVVVWVFERDPSSWTPYPPDVSNEIELTHTLAQNGGGSNKVQLAHLGPKWAGLEIDFSSMQQSKLGIKCQVDRMVLAPDTALAQGFVWEFEGDKPSEWFPYDLEMMSFIEEADAALETTTTRFSRSRRKQGVLDMSSLLGLPYTVDVGSKLQTRNDTGKKRKMRRWPLTTPYTSVQSGKSSGSQLPPPNSASAAIGKTKAKMRVTRLSLGKKVQVTGPPSTATSSRGRTSKSVPSKSSSSESLPTENNIRISTKPVIEKPAEQVLSHFMKRVDLTTLATTKAGNEKLECGGDKEEEEEECCICCDKLTSPSSYGDEGGGEAAEVVQLNRCGHMFHRLCMLEMYRAVHKDNSIQCPSCKLIYGEKTGICPPGVMTWSVLKGCSVAGYKGHDTISVTYDIRPGIQGPEHPHPGQAYNTQGFPRTGYLPDTDQGRKVLKLLMEAWRRRLMFTVGTSYTTGATNVVVWNEIHHKTELYGNYSSHGYPDPGYLDNVTLELASHGVLDNCLDG